MADFLKLPDYLRASAYTFSYNFSMAVGQVVLGSEFKMRDPWMEKKAMKVNEISKPLCS